MITTTCNLWRNAALSGLPERPIIPDFRWFDDLSGGRATRLLTDDERKQVEEYLAKLHGVTLCTV